MDIKIISLGRNPKKGGKPMNLIIIIIKENVKLILFFFKELFIVFQFIVFINLKNINNNIK